MCNNLFSNILIKRRIEKPRESGLTVIIDRGSGLKPEEQFLDLAADYIYLLKIITGIFVLLIELKTLREKIDLYPNLQTLK